MARGRPVSERLARIGWIDSLGVQALLWLLLSLLCMAAYWAVRIWSAIRGAASSGETVASQVPQAFPPGSPKR